MLADLQSDRVGADYRLRDSQFQRAIKARQCIDSARDILDQLRVCEEDSTGAEVAEDIAEYLDKLRS